LYFQAEDGIRDRNVTGVQTCALPIWDNDEIHMVTEPLNIEEILKTDTGEPFNGLPEDTVMGHLHLHVANIEEAVHFYSEGLGLDIVSRSGPQAAFLSFDKYHHHIGINVWNGV